MFKITKNITCQKHPKNQTKLKSSKINEMQKYSLHSSIIKKTTNKHKQNAQQNNHNNINHPHINSSLTFASFLSPCLFVLFKSQRIKFNDLISNNNSCKGLQESTIRKFSQ